MPFSSLSSRCSSHSIHIPDVPGASFHSLQASLVTNLSSYVGEYYYLNHKSVQIDNLSFCNVSLAYMHRDQTDQTNVQVWLPIDTWNGRMMGVGGGGWQAGLYPENFMAMQGAIGQGYAAVSTDGGHSADQNLSDWLLTTHGDIDYSSLNNFAAISLSDTSIIGKSIIKSFYGNSPKYSYWSGCSQGGRQGLVLAQRYPEAYDGIVASAPAINWSEFLVGGFWPQFIMNQLDAYPLSCELDFITNAAVASCDGRDGVEDGIISNGDLCNFDPYSLIGTTLNCDGRWLNISRAAADIAMAAWLGPISTNGISLWHGVGLDSNLTSPSSIASTHCYSNETCIGSPNILSSEWIQVGIARHPGFNLRNLTHAQYVQVFETSVQQYGPIIGTHDPDLTAFRDRGGKLLTYHGLADPIIPYKSTRQYYQAVASIDPDVRQFFRLFEAPGMGHCWSMSGLYPSTIFDAMVSWVEEGVVPENLPAVFSDRDGVNYERIICPYPEQAVYNGHGDPTMKSSFYCLAGR
ncbi:Tannase/feruloyl esterase [Aspergillus caelatus]|uniref:Carboxylic ester hydrolase n=1 Tax=Aspergillus caelatus TaxID=61420 RepID=A0A5N7AKH8_9EURO|nr:Tannase/feruloyl esterase [Aspergillus caelatus]KAE8370392.1 Tannase/feruloyl esterase [Aspergillus caelatus]